MIDLAKIHLNKLTPCRIGKTADPGRARWCCCARSLGLGLVMLWCTCTPVLSQDPFAPGDPFGAPADSAKPQAAAVPAFDSAASAPPAAVVEESDPLIRMLQLVPPKTPTEFAETLEWMVRIGRWDEVGRYLDLVQKAAWNRDQLAELSRAGGAALWFRLRDAGSELSEAQLKFVDQLAALPAQLARDPQWIDGWINRLAAASPADRREAQMRLEQANRAAIQRLCTRLLAGDQLVPGVRMVESLLEFNADGIEALRSACVANDPTARERVLFGLAQSSTREFGVELGSALQSAAISATARQALADVLHKKYGKLPTPSAVRDYMVARFERQLDDYQLTRSRTGGLLVKVWRVGIDGKSVNAVETTSANRSLELLAQIAAHRAAHSVLTHEDIVDCATVLHQHSYQSLPGVETADPTGQVLIGLPEEASGSDFWKQVLDRSQTWQMHGASIRAAQAIGRELATSSPGAASFDFIASCLRDSRPVMRYIAVDAIARANIKTAYNGSASALESAIEMTRLGQGPMVLVVGLTAELRQVADQQLLALGAHSISVNSTQAALKILDQPYPIEMIMVVDRVPRNSLLVLVERLRHSRRGGSLPIAVLTDQLENFEASELSRYPGVVMSVLSHEPDHMPRIITQLELQLDVRPLSAAERTVFVDTANSLLAAIAADRQQYSFYPLARWGKELESAAESMPTGAWLTVLGGLGTSDSQQRLASIASDQSTGNETRAQAAAAFSSSIKQYGLLLGRAAVLHAYDVYNAQGPNDPVTVSALGQVLDAIESRTANLDAVSAP